MTRHIPVLHKRRWIDLIDRRFAVAGLADALATRAKTDLETPALVGKVVPAYHSVAAHSWTGPIVGKVALNALKHGQKCRVSPLAWPA